MSARILDLLVAAGTSTVGALAVKATLALLSAFLLIRLARGASASLRHLVAAATFGVLLLLPLAAVLVPARVITVPPPAAGASAHADIRAVAPATAQARVATAPAATWRLPRASDLALGAYLVGVGGLALSLLAGIVRLHRMRGRAEVSVAGTRLANLVARQEGMPGGIEVAVSGELAVPVTFGWTHPVILLPAETAEWDEQSLGRAVRHELEHIARADWASNLVSKAALALYWPHPFAWVLWRRLRLEAERACDDAVIRRDGQAETYAEQLVALARRLRGRGTVPALSMATRGTLGLRVDAILDSRLRRAPRTRLASLVVGGAAVAAMLAIAPLRVLEAAVPVADDPVELGEGSRLDRALLQAAEEGDLETMRRLIDRGARADAAIDGDGSPLIAASRQGHLPAIEMLLAAGANVNRGVAGDGNPLLNAAREGHLDAVRLLLEKGADIDAGVPGDGNALIMAAGAGQIEVVRFLLDQGAALEKVVPGDENPLIHACEGGQAGVVRLLIERGANVNARVRAGRQLAGRGGEWRTPLSMARRNGREDIVRILLAAGAVD